MSREVLVFARDFNKGRVMPKQSILVTVADIEECMMRVFNEELQRREHPRYMVMVQRLLERFVTTLLEKATNVGDSLKEVKMPLLQNKTLKITMLGTVGAGKTCYMLGMYAEMVTGVNGITINSIDLDVGTKLLNQWERLVSSEGSDRWPPGTPTGTEEFNFHLSYNTKPIMRFNWMDYRGAALTETANESDVKQLQDRLIISDCTLLCVPAEAIAQDVKSTTVVKYKTNRLNDLLARFATENTLADEESFPVVIVLTKFDEIADKISQDDLIRRVKRLFPALFPVGGIWDVAICPVSLGLELALDKDSGDINPFNLHLPIVFAVWHKLVKMRIAAGLPKNKDWLGKLLPTMVLGTIPQSDLKDFEKKIVLLSEELKDIPIFRKGEQLFGYEDV
ncbi:hypothetical protein WA1_20710 [Scytonema hofmannii PCC 7110]|uniref:Double-GTPase 2 domain-containing protein n=1 Tax=Scytonema hofmannii PCC 7110 TaxID=128403 RepID=A0A139XCP8_9CYAN|nr:hypothetical protein [Scytonema hofmannii]KYC42392.1 hypothetical protein WA1_20710 [Scytonema hofmannii PCC 7110]